MSEQKKSDPSLVDCVAGIFALTIVLGLVMYVLYAVASSGWVVEHNLHERLSTAFPFDSRPRPYAHQCKQKVARVFVLHMNTKCLIPDQYIDTFLNPELGIPKALSPPPHETPFGLNARRVAPWWTPSELKAPMFGILRRVRMGRSCWEGVTRLAMERRGSDWLVYMYYREETTSLIRCNTLEGDEISIIP